jgi:4-diphosphocytidyl-2-C-methyl-D-erythritol kinase
MSFAHVNVAAPAKVNLTLEVLGRRPDGYHEIRSVMQAISLVDHLRVVPAERLQLTCNRRDLERPSNLVWRAAHELLRESGQRAGAAMRLEKHIPTAAGLGGGSSDAAAALSALNALWKLGLSRATLRHLAARLGSDVPFFLGDTACALAEGRGERITPIAPLTSRWIVLVKPPFGISAADVYRAFPSAGWSDGARTDSWLRQALAGGDVPTPFNALERIALQLAPAATAARDALLAAGAPHAVMTGSGPTYFALFRDEMSARRTLDRLGHGSDEVHLATFAGLAAPGGGLEVTGT